MTFREGCIGNHFPVGIPGLCRRGGTGYPAGAAPCREPSVPTATSDARRNMNQPRPGNQSRTGTPNPRMIRLDGMNSTPAKRNTPPTRALIATPIQLNQAE